MKQKFALLFTAIAAIMCTIDSLAFESIVEEELQTPWEGFGYNQWGYARESDGNTFKPWDDELWTITEQRILAIRPSTVRLPLLREWFNTDDNDQPLPIGTYNWDSKYMQAFYKTMDLYKEHDIKVMSGLWGVNLRSVEIEDYNNFYQSDEAIKLHADLLEHLIKVKGYGSIITTYAPTNEPLGSNISFESWSNMCKKLYTELGKRGLPQNILSGADSWGGWIWDPAQYNKEQLSAYDFHHYLNQTPKDANDQLFNRLIEKNFSEYLSNISKFDNSNKPVYVSELAPMGTAYIDKPVDDAPIHCQINSYECALGFMDYGIQLARSGMASGLAWGLDGFEWGKNAGMWNNSGAHGGMTLRPWYYTWQLMCRYFPRGAKILKMSEPSDQNDLRIVGAKIGEDDYTFAIVNRRTNANSTAQEVTINVNCTKQTLYLYHFNKTNAGDGVSLSLPYQTILQPLNQTTISIPMEEGVLITTLPPLNIPKKEQTSTLLLDFESNSDCMLLMNNQKQTTVTYASNPRKKEPNTSNTVCQIETTINEYNDERDCFGTISLNKNVLIENSHYLNIQLYKNRTETVGVALHFVNDDNLYGSEINVEGRKWNSLQFDLTLHKGKTIDYIAIYPKRGNEQSLTEYETVAIDNIELVTTPTSPIDIDVMKTYLNPEYTPYLNIGFEYIDPNVTISSSDLISAQIESNPKIQETNDSQYVCKIESDPNNKGQYVKLELFPAVSIPFHNNALSFKYYNNKSNQNIKVVLSFLSGETVEKEFLIIEKRLWQTLYIDLEPYKEQTINSIAIFPDNIDEANADNINYSYLDDFRFTTYDFSSITETIDKRSIVYQSNGIVYIKNSKAESIEVYTIDGKLIKNITSPYMSNTSFNIDHGAYIIKIGNETHKIFY